ncbi:MAG: energy transducer TonB [Candidatus Krumholzibacteriia bacterium]
MRHQRDPLHIRWAYSLVGVTEFPVSGEKHPLEREAPRYVIWSAGTALIVGLSLFIAWQWWSTREPEADTGREVNIVRYTELGVPPSIDRTASNQVNMAQQVAVAAPPAIAVPEPVPDELAVDQTIMTQMEIDAALAPITQTDLGDMEGTVVVTGGIKQQNAETGGYKAAVNVLPVRLGMKPPVYPEMARMAGIEGTVIVQVLVGKDGRVQRAKAVEGPVQLRDAAIAAAMTATFRAASTDGRPVSVWVAIPLRFKLH